MVYYYKAGCSKKKQDRLRYETIDINITIRTSRNCIEMNHHSFFRFLLLLGATY